MTESRHIIPTQVRSDNHIYPSSFPPLGNHAHPALHYWTTDPQISQTRAGAYTSPDTSPTTPQHGARGYPYQSFAYPGPDSYRRASEPVRMGRLPGLFPQGRGHVVHRGGPMRRGKKGRHPKKVEGKQPTFLTKLYAILDQPEYHDIIRWDEPGEIIIIEKPDELSDKILPLVYRQSRFASFSRQLNIYGFMRKVSLRHVERGVCHPDVSTWSHEFLRRDSPRSEIIGFKRRVPPRPSQRKDRGSMPDEGMSTSESSGSFSQSPPEGYPNHFVASPRFAMPYTLAHAPNAPFFVQGMDARMSMTQPDQGLFEAHSSPSIPQTAPIDQSFGLPVLVSQGHIRTRSVQGEPPSATLFSPTSPIAQPAFNHAEETRNEAGVPQIYHPSDAATSMQRGFAGLTTNIANPASMPNQLAPIKYLPSDIYVERPSISAALSEDSPPTVSPGAYQARFTSTYAASYSYGPISPAAFEIQHQARSPEWSSHYVPRANHLPIAAAESLPTKEGEDVAEYRTLESSALPSASLEEHKHPFETEMQDSKEDETMAVDAD